MNTCEQNILFIYIYIFSTQSKIFHLAFMLPPMSVELWTAIKKTLHQCGGDTSPCLHPYPMAACPEFQFSCRLGREIFTFPAYINYIVINFTKCDRRLNLCKGKYVPMDFDQCIGINILTYDQNILVEVNLSQDITNY